MSNISSIQNVQSTLNTTGLSQVTKIDASLLELAKGALSAVNIQQSPQSGGGTFFQQSSLEVSFLQNNASNSLKEAIMELNLKQEVTMEELSALYFENGQLRDGYDLFFADVVVAKVLLENIKLSLDENTYLQELQDLTDNVQNLVLATDKTLAQNYADRIDSIVEKLENNVSSDAKENFEQLRILLDNKMHYLQRVTTIENALHEIADLGKFEGEFPSELKHIQFSHKNNAVGAGVLAFAEEKLLSVFNELRLNNLLQHLSLNDLPTETVEKLYNNSDDKTKAIIENFSSTLLQELKTNLQTNSLSEIFSIFHHVELFAQNVMLTPDKDEILQDLKEKELQLCKDFIATNQGNENLITANNVETVVKLLENTSYSKGMISTLTNETSFNSLFSLQHTDNLTKQEKSELLRSIIAQVQNAGLGINEITIIINELTSDKEILEEFAGLSSYLFLQPLLKENNLLSMYDVKNINFSAMKEVIEVLMQSDTKEKSFNNFVGLFVNTAFLFYKSENAITIEQAKNVAEFIETFSTDIQVKIKELVDKHNFNIFHSSFDSNLAKSVLYAASYGLNSRVLFSALRSFDDNAKFDSAIKMANQGFQKLIGIDSVGNFSKIDLLHLAAKQIQNSSLVQNNARLEELNLAQAFIRGEYENIISSKEFINLMQVQKVSKPEDISGETLATSLNLIQRLLVKDLGELSNYQLAKLGLTREEIESSYFVKQAIYNADDNIKNSFEYALLITSYFAMTNKTDVQSQEEILTAINANNTIREYINFLSLPDNEKRVALEGLTINGRLFVDLAKFETSTINLKSQNKQGITLKNNLAILTSSKTSENDKNRARQEIIKLLQGTETQPLSVWGDCVLAVKKHGSIDNTNSLTLALDKAIKNNNELLTGIGKLYTKDKLFSVNLTDKTGFVEKQIDNERKILLSDYDKVLLDSCTKVVLGLACVEFDYADYRTMLRDYATKQNSFSELDKIEQFKTYMQETFIELGIDKSVVSSLIDNLVFHALDRKEKINQQLSEIMQKSKAVINALPYRTTTGKMEDLVLLYKSSMNILEELESEQAIYIDGKTGLSLEIEQFQAGIDMENIFSIQRNEYNEPVVQLGSGFIGELGIELELHDAVTASAKANANAMGVLSLTFNSDSDASIFMAKVLSRLTDKSDLFYAKNAYVGSRFGGGVELSSEVNIANLIGFDYADFGFGFEVSGNGSYYTVRGTKQNETHLKGAYTLTGEIGIKLSDSVKELAEKPISGAEALGVPSEFSKSHTFSVEKELIGITDIFNKQLTKLVEEHTLLESMPQGIKLFGKKHNLTQEQIEQLLKYHNEHKDDGIKIKIQYSYDIDNTNIDTSVANQMKNVLSNNSRQLQSCSVIITKEDNDRELELPYNIAGITFGIHQNYQAIKTATTIV